MTEYIAFGEVFFEEHAVSPKMPYLFNGKELDQDTGLYYYGARYYDPKVSLWLNVDPLVEKNAYVNNNPIMLVDPDGRFPILINGRVSNDSERKNPIYWSQRIRETIKNRTGYNYNQFKYVDGDKGMWASTRISAGLKQGKIDAVSVYSKLKESIKDGMITEQLQIFSHSRGSAFSSGYIRGLAKEIIRMAKKDNIGFAYGEQNIIEYSVNLAPHQSNFIHYSNTGAININVSHYGDLLSGNDATGNVINIHSVGQGLDQHGNDTYNTELNFILETLQTSNKNDIKDVLRGKYKEYDKGKVSRDNGQYSRVE